MASWKKLHQPHREAALRVGNRIERLVTVSVCPGETVAQEAALLARVKGFEVGSLQLQPNRLRTTHFKALHYHGHFFLFISLVKNY